MIMTCQHCTRQHELPDPPYPEGSFWACWKCDTMHRTDGRTWTMVATADVPTELIAKATQITAEVRAALAARGLDNPTLQQAGDVIDGIAQREAGVRIETGRSMIDGLIRDMIERADKITGAQQKQDCLHCELLTRLNKAITGPDDMHGVVRDTMRAMAETIAIRCRPEGRDNLTEAAVKVLTLEMHRAFDTTAALKQQAGAGLH